MIKFCDDKIQEFINFLNKNYNTKENVKLFIMPSCFKTDMDDLFGFYEENSNMIIIPYIEELEEREDKDLQLMGIIAHEYRHFMNEKLGLENNEDDCDNFAYKVIEEFTGGKVKGIKE